MSKIFYFFNQGIADSITNNKTLIRNMEKEVLLKKVQENVYRVPSNQSEEIDVVKGTIIVLGWQEYRDNALYSFALMGKYESGNISDVFLNNSVVLELTPLTQTAVDIPLATEEKDYMETAEWWRLPTDEEMELYNIVYNCK